VKQKHEGRRACHVGQHKENLGATQGRRRP